MAIRIGLDVGIASCGWCVIDPEEEKILGLGVRTFPRAETPKDGSPLAAARREKRGARRRLTRAANRMRVFRQMVVDSGILTEDELAAAFTLEAGDLTPYELRLQGLDRPLTPVEWVRVLSQICKRRGYKSMRLDGNDPKDTETGQVLSAIKQNEGLLQEKGYRTAGEMLAVDPRFSERKRNRRDYLNVMTREMLVHEAEMLFEAQRKLGNEFATKAIEEKYLEILNWQQSITEGDALRAMVGRCTFVPEERRAARASTSFEIFRFVDKLNSARYVINGESFALTPEVREKLLATAFSRKTPMDYTAIRKEAALPDEARFTAVRAHKGEDYFAEEKKTKLPALKAYQGMRTVIEKADPGFWSVHEQDIELLDRVADILTYTKSNDLTRAELEELDLPSHVVEALVPLVFVGNGHLSITALRAITPFMLQGERYDEAARSAGFHHSVKKRPGGHSKVPPIPVDEVTNPVVRRALSQTRKVINAIINEWGSPEEIHIELGREVAKSHKDRGEIEKGQKENRARNDKIRERWEAEFDRSITPHDFVKVKLAESQNWRCAYTGNHIDFDRVASGEAGYVQVDHILPYSRSFDNGYNNRVLVLASANQEKREQTPFEWLGNDEREWHRFTELVKSMKFPIRKEQNLLTQTFSEREGEFRERNLIDTQYAARFLKGFLEEHLDFAGEKKRPVITVNGRVTAYLRNAWQLQKIRDDGDKHHALDAAVVAVTGQGMIQHVSRFLSGKHSRRNPDTKIVRYEDPETGREVEARHVPEPWEGFADQVRVWMSDDPMTAKVFNESSITAEERAAIKPFIVSRMPRRSVGGEIHAETIRRIEGTNEKGMTRSSKKVALSQLKLKDLEKMVGRQHGDHALYELLRTRLEAHDDKPEKAFAEPVFKPTRPGRVAPRVNSVRIEDSPTSGGVEVRGGIADNGGIIRTDVFSRDGKYYLVPVYRVHAVHQELPNRAIVAHKPESEWREMDESYDFRFSLFPGDWVRLERKKDLWEGQYVGVHRGTGLLTIRAHDGSWEQGGLGVVMGVISFEKFEVDVLGRTISRVKKEKRRGFQKRGGS